MENSIKDRNSIQHLIDYIRFDFYDTETVKRISMRPITDSVAFDNFSNANPGGVHDPVMGVSAYDALSSCVTCGLNNDNCTGHFGHIELSAPVYNPFMMNYLLKLLNMKCFNCHKLRFHKKYKIYIFLKILLMKLGLIKEATMLKGLMFSTVAESNHHVEVKIRELLAGISGNLDILIMEEESAINDESIGDTLENTENSSGDRHGSFDSNQSEDTNNTKDTNLTNGNGKSPVKKNKKKEMSEERKEKENKKELNKQMTNKLKSDMKNAKTAVIDEIIAKIIELNEKIECDHNNKIKFLYDQNLNSNINVKSAVSEFWKMASSKCPNCNALNSRIKKQGNKFFQQPLSKKQKKKMANFGINPNKDALEEGTAYQEEIKIKKNMNKISKKKMKKEQGESDDMIHEEEVEESSDSGSEIDEALIGVHDSLKYLHPLEIKEHIKRLWEIDGDLLSLVFGNLLKKIKTASKNEKNNLGYKAILKADKTDKWAFEISSTGPFIFFLETLIVPPNRFRPENKGGGDSMYLNAQSQVFTKILNLNNEIRTLSLKIKEEDVKEGEKKVTMKDLIAKWVELQDSVNMLYDSTKVSNNKKEGDKGKGIRQLIEKKHGIVRMKMMGKRVNYAGRSVISPDPMISASEVGIPVSIAQKLVFPETVTKYNLETLRQLVINGPKKYPGANLIAKENGKMISLEHVPDEYRVNIIAAKLHEGTQTVYRHLLTGDALLVNRQPTLHKPSIMSHKAKVLKGENTIRLHYANCNTYNADFDGDEMNLHFLQNHIARQEAYTISNTDNQYIVPTSGKPIRGLIQDSIVSAVYLTMKDSFFTKEEYFQIVYFCLDTSLHNGVIKKICLQPPVLLKPKVLYTGKQIITTVLKSLATSPKVDHIVQENSVGINFQHHTRLSRELWGMGHHQMEGTVTVSDNELLTGVLDKNHIGNTEFGMVHSFYEVYGPEMAGELIFVFGKLFIYYFQYFHGFTCGVNDLILQEEYNLKRRRDIEDIIISGMEGLGNFFDIPDFKLNFNNYSKRNVFTRQTQESIAEIKLLPQERKQIEKLIRSQNLKMENLFKTDDDQDLENIEEREADEKSNDLIKELREKFHETIIKDETNTIESNLDVIVKNSMNKLSSDYSKNWISKGLVKTFPRNYFSMMVLSGAKGSLVNLSQIACMLGQQELEGKRVPRMASGRTLPSFEPFDANPRAGGFVSDRFSTGIRPQEFFFHCMAGREGLIDTAVKTSRSGYLQRCLVKHLEQLMVNYDYTVRDTDGSIIQFLYGEDSIDTMNTRYLSNFKFIANNMDTYFDKFKPERFVGKLDTSTIRKVRKDFDGSTDTLLNKYEPWRYLGSISDKVYENMINYMEKNPDKLFSEKDSGNSKNKIDAILNAKKASKNSFKTVIFSKFLNSMVQPGESVGILAAQSIGEPSTQMTLNTFHLAGHGGVNMTLGIPRLREILMTSEDNIKTPIMILPCLSNNIETIKKLARNFEKYVLIDIIKEVSIKQKIDLKNKQKYRKYSITITTEDFEAIKNYFYYDEEQILKILKVDFVPTLVKCIAKQTKQLYKNTQIIVNKLTAAENGKAVDDDEKEENEADFDSKKKHTSKDESDEESNDENDYEDVEGTKNKKKTKEDTEENYTDSEERTDTLNNDTDMNVDEEYSKGDEQEDSEEISEGEDIKIVSDEDENETGEEKEKTKQKTVDDLIKEKNYSFEEIRVENMLYAFDMANFSFELYIPFNQKNLLLKNILDQVFKKINFKSVEKVKKCHILERKRGDGKEHVLQLEGINFKEAVKYHEHLDLNRIYTNDIGNILRIYGIEACRAAIVKEINAVFESYNITVDNRHLGLIADYITQQGKYRTFNRKGISTSSSPFLKMTYETTMDFLIQSCIGKEVDDLKSASSRIALGQVAQFGTGSFSILQNVAK